MGEIIHLISLLILVAMTCTAPVINTARWEQSGEFEGDIIIPVSSSSENAAVGDNFKWPNAEVPYEVSSQFDTIAPNAKAVIQQAINEYEEKTCIRFVPRNGQSDYVFIQPGRGCSSSVGRQGLRQPINLGNGCVHQHIIVHEFMHALGFWHEQSRADRDQYVTVNFNNVLPGRANNFRKFTLKDVQHLGEDYDYSSLMHYDSFAFSTGAGPTITPNQQGVTIGRSRQLSEVDARKLNKLYNCDERGTGNCKNENENCEYWADIGQCEVNPKYMLESCKKACKVCDSCVDENKNCGYWESVGECSKTPAYMLENCKKACKVCTSSQEECKDEHQSCEYWTGVGECTKNPNYMLANCQKSCQVCGYGTECKNEDESCEYWSDIGECEANPNYMLQYCRPACGICAQSFASAPACEDKNDNCKYWASIGECDTNPDYMLHQCKKSCKVCGTSTRSGEAVCADKNRYCAYWAGDKECETNPGYMLEHCKLSCGVC